MNCEKKEKLICLPPSYVINKLNDQKYDLACIVVLDISFCNLGSLNGIPFDFLSSLKKFYFERNNIRSLTPLKNIKSKIVKLRFDSNFIEDLSILSEFKNLEKLYFSNNNVSSLIPLMSLNDLLKISYHHNPIKSYKGLPERILYIIKDNVSLEHIYVDDIFRRNTLTKCRQMYKILERSGTSKFRIIKEILEKKELSWISWINIFDFF